MKYWFPQFGIKPVDSIINQLSPITHKVRKKFDYSFEVIVDSLDISKMFDKVWPKWIIFKRKKNRLSGKLHSALFKFIKRKKESYIRWARVFMNRCWFKSRSGILVDINILANGWPIIKY